MGFVLTLLYVSLALLSPGIISADIASYHVMEVLGALVILSLLPGIASAMVVSTVDSYLLLALLFSTVFSTMLTGWMGGAAAIFTGFLPIMFTFYFVMIGCQSLTRLKILAGVLTLTSIFIFSQGAIADYSKNLMSPYLLLESGTLVRYRGLGLVSDPNDLAQLFVVLIPLLWLRWKKGSFVANTLFTLLPAGILVVAVYFTHSRGGTIALLAIILFGFKDKLGIVKSLVIAGIGAVAMMALDVSGGRGMDNDDGGRVALWGTGLQVFRAHPLFGVGPDNFSNYNGNFQTAHNSYVLGLAELGIFGYFFWMALIVSGWMELSKIIGKKKTKTVDPLDEDDLDSFDRHQSFAASPAQRAFETEGTAVLAHSTGLAGFDSYLVRPKAASGWSPSYSGFEKEAIDADAREEADLVYAAKIIRIAMVGFLASAFFLSRTYSIPLYLVLGMAAAVRTMYRKKHPEVAQNLPRLLRNVGITIMASIVFLYGFVRLHGVH